MGTRGYFFWTPQLPPLLMVLAPSIRGVLALSPNAMDMYWVWDSKRRHRAPSFPVSDCVITSLPTCQCIGHAFWHLRLESLCHLLSTNCLSDEAWSGLWIGAAFTFFFLVLCFCDVVFATCLVSFSPGCLTLFGKNPRHYRRRRVCCGSLTYRYPHLRFCEKESFAKQCKFV